MDTQYLKFRPGREAPGKYQEPCLYEQLRMISTHARPLLRSRTGAPTVQRTAFLTRAMIAISASLVSSFTA